MPSRMPGRPNGLAGVVHASMMTHRPRSTGVLSASWIENAVSSPTSREFIVATKNDESSQNLWYVETNWSMSAHRVATHSAFVLVLLVVLIASIATARATRAARRVIVEGNRCSPPS
jgi:heme A synthase